MGLGYYEDIASTFFAPTSHLAIIQICEPEGILKLLVYDVLAFREIQNDQFVSLFLKCFFSLICDSLWYLLGLILVRSTTLISSFTHDVS